MEALKNYGLKNFFLTPCLRAQPELLQYLINIWDKNQEKFILWDQELDIDVSDVYFITGLSWRGATPLLTSTRPCMENMTMVIDRVCPGARKGPSSGKVDRKSVV